MNEPSVRPTKKQQELLTFIEAFITEHGYSPSYREIMAGCDYTSVATVALHVRSLILRGHLRKRDRSARSLELVHAPKQDTIKSNAINPGEEKWLIEKVEYYLTNVEEMMPLTQAAVDEVQVLLGALRILGLGGATQSFLPRVTVLKQRLNQVS